MNIKRLWMVMGLFIIGIGILPMTGKSLEVATKMDLFIICGLIALATSSIISSCERK